MEEEEEGEMEVEVEMDLPYSTSPLDMAGICRQFSSELQRKFQVGRLQNHNQKGVLIAMKVCTDKEFSLAGSCIHSTYRDHKSRIVVNKSNYTNGTKSNYY